jgi:hypothetical protein
MAVSRMLVFAVMAALTLASSGCGSAPSRGGPPAENQVAAALRHAGLTRVGGARGKAMGRPDVEGCQAGRARYAVVGALPEPVNSANPSGGFVFVWAMPSARMAARCAESFAHYDGVWQEVMATHGLVISSVAFTRRDAVRIRRASHAVAAQLSEN